MQDDFKICRCEDALDLPFPKYMTEGSSGMDLYANVNEDTVIKKGEIGLISTGIKISIPKGYEVQIRARSGLALNHGITMANGIGTIDSDYRGEIKALLINLGKEDFVITRKMRIAQMVINKIEQVKFLEVESLDLTERGNGGFGHTGIH